MTPPSRRPADWYEGRSPHARSAQVWADADGLWVEPAGAPARLWPHAEVVVVRASRGGPVQLERRADPVEVIIAREPAVLADLRAAAPTAQARRLGRASATGARHLVTVLATAVVLLLALWRFGIPWLADAAAVRVPVEWERQAGRTMVSQMVPEAKRVRDPAVTMLPTTIHHALRGPLGGELLVWRDPMVNAFAAPGGTVVVTTGLLARLTGPDQLAAVVAHEVGHVERRHHARRVLRDASVQVLLALLVGDTSPAAGALQAAGQLAQLSYSREHERESDDYAVETLARHGLPAEAMAQALECIAQGNDGAGRMPAFVSTHPGTEERVARVRAAADAHPVAGTPPWNGDGGWAELQRAVAAMAAADTIASAPGR
ncbi:MAG: M48 family metallopeptidase [bacterium]